MKGFLTYGGMSVREIEAIAVGLEETMDENMVNQGPQFIEYMVESLKEGGVPVITPAGGLGCHVNAMEFYRMYRKANIRRVHWHLHSTW